MVVIDEDLLDTFGVGPDSPSTRFTMRCDGVSPSSSPPTAHRTPSRATGAPGHGEARIVSLQRLVAQLDAIVSGRPKGWAGVGERGVVLG